MAALQVALIVTHAPWLDEYQALQIAVQAPDIPTLLDWLRYEGHPPLWYFILRGLAHLVEPLDALPLAALILAAVAQGAILFASPFTRAERLLIASSQFVLFDFLTLSRSLTLGVALVVAAVALWRSRWSWLMIALLPMADFLFGVISGVLVLLKWRERMLYRPGVVLWLSVGALAAWTVRPAPDIILASEGQGILRDGLYWLSSVGTLAVPFQGGVLPVWNTAVTPLAGILWVAFLWFAWVQTRADHFHRFVMFGFIALTLCFSLAIYPLALRHLMLIALLLIVLSWLHRARQPRADRGFQLWLGIVAVCGLVTAAINFIVPFDSAALAAAEIKRLGLADKHWVSFPESPAQGVTALTGIPFMQTERRCMQSFVRWNHRSALLTQAQLARYLRDESDRYGRFYLLSDQKLSGLPYPLVRRLAAIDAGYDGQRFYLFEIGQGKPPAKPNFPPCAANRRPFTKLSW